MENATDTEWDFCPDCHGEGGFDCYSDTLNVVTGGHTTLHEAMRCETCSGDGVVHIMLPKIDMQASIEAARRDAANQDHRWIWHWDGFVGKRW